jgi:predicted double-glycine peptidase
MIFSPHRLLCLLSLLGGLPAALAGGGVDIPVQAGGAFSVPVLSMKELRYRNTIRQQFDFSCGSAALATLLTHHYNYPVSEQEVFREMFERGDKAKIQKDGFSLLDIKNYLTAHGFQSDGYIAEVDKLVVAKIPAIALIKESGYHHFVVLKGVKDGRVLIGDPSSGTRAVTEAQFKQMTVNNILFVIRSRQDIARFNLASDWSVTPRGPISEGIYRSIGDYALPKRGPGDF